MHICAYDGECDKANISHLASLLSQVPSLMLGSSAQLSSSVDQFSLFVISYM